MQTREELRLIDLDHIQVSRAQPRRHFACDEIAQLAASIKAVGLIHPPLVQELPEQGSYELIAGERRVRACKEAGMTSIRVLVRLGDPSLTAQLALIENVQRVDLNPLEIARSLRKLVENFGLTQRDLARRIGKKRSTIANYMRLLTLPESIQHSLQAGKVSMGHAKAILALPTTKQQENLHREVLLRQLTVREAEEAAKATSTQSAFDADEALHLKDLESKIQQRTGARVEVKGKGVTGKVVLHYCDLDELDRILEVLQV